MFDSEEDMLHALEQKEIDKGDVIVIRYEGPKGGPGMPEMLTPTSAIMGAGLRQGRRAASPTADSPAARTASSSATSRRKRRKAGRSRW